MFKVTYRHLLFIILCCPYFHLPVKSICFLFLCALVLLRVNNSTRRSIWSWPVSLGTPRTWIYFVYLNGMIEYLVRCPKEQCLFNGDVSRWFIHCEIESESQAMSTLSKLTVRTKKREERNEGQPVVSQLGWHRESSSLVSSHLIEGQRLSTCLFCKTKINGRHSILSMSIFDKHQLPFHLVVSTHTHPIPYPIRSRVSGRLQWKRWVHPLDSVWSRNWLSNEIFFHSVFYLRITIGWRINVSLSIKSTDLLSLLQRHGTYGMLFSSIHPRKNCVTRV